MATELEPAPPRDSPALRAAAIDAIEAALGGRARLQEALALAPPDPTLDPIIGLLTHPAYDTRKLSALCAASGITVGQLLQAIKSGKYAKMWVQATETITTQTPAVVEDLFTRAQPHLVPCPVCVGDGSLVHTDPKGVRQLDAPRDPCLPCKATGQMTVLPDLERQRLALDIAGVIPKKAPLAAIDARSVTLLAPHAATSDAYAKLLQATDAILRRPRVVPAPDPITEGEVVSLAPDEAP